jgi:PAS fold
METEFNRLVDALPGLVWTALPDGGADFIDHQWSEYTGMSLTEALGSGWPSAIHPDDLSHLLERWAGFLASGRANAVEVRLPRSINLPMAADRYTLAADKLESQSVKLNGQTLHLGPNDELPALCGADVKAGTSTLHPASITFMTFTAAHNTDCH